MNTNTEIKRCKCGYPIIVYIISHDIETHKKPYFHFFDGQSNNYKQIYICPGCHSRLDFIILN